MGISDPCKAILAVCVADVADGTDAAALLTAADAAMYADKLTNRIKL